MRRLTSSFEGWNSFHPFVIVLLMKPHDYYYLAKTNILPGAELRKRNSGKIEPGMKVHVSASCGKAMASVAVMLKEFGCIVTGSDAKFSPPMSDVLDSHEIPKLSPSLKNLEGIDILVVGNTQTYDALEVSGAREKNIPMLSGSEVLGQIFSGKRSFVVAGTHGKTTTSALLTHTFLRAERNPAYMIGGVFQDSGESSSMGSKNTNFVIYEGDEYNCAFFDQAPKFLRYEPTSAIITSIEHDHVDLYPTLEDYKQAFQFLVESLPKDGFLVVHESATAILDTGTCPAKVITYGASPSADVSYQIDNTDSEGTNFLIKMPDREISVKIPMFGNYNVENALAVFTLSISENLPEEKILNALKDYPGTKERQELVGEKKNGIVIIRDYAHHPTAVALTLEGVRLHYPRKRVIAVFEPRSASSKRKVFEERYGDSLSLADATIIVNPEIQGNPTDDQINIPHIKKIIESRGKGAYEAVNNDEVLEILPKEAKAGDVIIFMSSGDMNGVPNKFLFS